MIWDAPASDHTTTCRVLVVDDNEEDRVEMRRLLLQGSPRHYEFVEVATGEAAIHAALEAGSGPPYCLLIDYYLPDMDAPEVIAALRGRDSLPVCPIVVITGQVATEMGRIALRGGAQDYIGKDWLSPPALTRAVENAVERFALARKLRDQDEAIRTSEERFRAFMDNSPAAAWVKDGEGRIVFYNRTFLEWIGSESSQVVGRLESDLFPSIAEEHRGTDRKVLETGEAAKVEEHLDLPGGDRRTLLKVEFPLLDQGGKRLIGGVGIDITDLRRTEQALRELNSDLERRVAERTAEVHSLARIIDASTDFIATATLDGRPLWENGAFREVAGIAPEGVRRPASIADLHPTEASLRILGHGIPAAVREGHWTGETEILSADGRTIPVSQLILAHRDDDGQVAFVSTIMRDITDRMRLEGILRERSDALSRANAELQRASRLKDEFLANMSHELRTPLNGILGISEGLLEGVYGRLDEAQHRSVSDIRECGQHLLALINDVLDVAKIEAGMVRLDLEEVEVEPLCNASIRFVREAAQKKSIALRLTVDPAAGTIVADGRRLKQVLVNLLSNAVKFTEPRGSVGLDVAAVATAREVAFTVWDTGIGISQEGLDQLFRPFMQLDAGLSRHQGGTGLGLVLVKRLTELHGGSLRVQSAPGKGSRFTVAVPRTRESTAVVSAPQAADDAALPEAAAPDPIPPIPKILVVDDDPTSVRAMEDYLRFKGCSVEVTRDGESAIDCAKGMSPDLILMDIQMPGLDGLEAIRRIRALTGIGGVPIIALTALAMREDRGRALEAGADEYVTKPVNLSELHGRIRELLSAARR
ncbi:MAG: response regulator [Isosphaeraceae bacterium]